ncbi:MAG TPA: transporter [Nitrospinaceae bacterium]|nr:transporter [Nitrospinaceae bacterium]
MKIHVKNFFLLLVFSCSNGFAKTDLQPESILEQYQQLLTQQQKEFVKQRQLIAKQGKEIERLKIRLNSLSLKISKKQAVTTKKLPPPLSTAKKTKKLTLPSSPVGQAPTQTAEEKDLPEMAIVSDTVGGVLTRKGNLVVEPSLTYAYSDGDRVFLDGFTLIPSVAVGLIDLREIQRRSYIGSLTARYGVTDRLEIDFKLPYIYRDDQQRSRAVSIGVGEDEIFDADGNDIGDLGFSVRYQINDGADEWPIFIGNMALTMPTGTSPFEVETEQSTPGATFPTELATGSGYLSLQPSVTALYPTDSVVFFGNLSYAYNVETDESIGEYDPGDTLGVSFGMGFSINERSSFSLGYSHRYIFETEVDGSALNGSNLDIGTLLIGYSFKFTPQTNINLSFDIGVTEAAQDVSMTLRIPMTFDFLSNFQFPNMSARPLHGHPAHN